ncbi:hypothetical protein, partial [Roseibium aggregatum]|uniref:hypothetical protein n=1 Tax=Roseibium aggregatum TaxID=187304 RepID=UPI001AD91136
RLHTFLPRSIPSTKIDIGPFLSTSNTEQSYRIAPERGGPSHNHGMRTGSNLSFLTSLVQMAFGTDHLLRENAKCPTREKDLKNW